MKTIVYIVPYFGKLPSGFEYWLRSCEVNTTINWLLVTDINFDFKLPNNFKLIKMSFEELKNKIQDMYDFKIAIDRPWKLCDFRPAYGEIFEEYISEFDFWGHCDVDLIFGNIRTFITDDLLNKFDKIGFQGHSTIYRNKKDVNVRYRMIFNGIDNYRDVFSINRGFCFDEGGISKIYEKLNIEYYKNVNFAHLKKYDINFFLGHKNVNDDYKNYRQVFVWQNGTLTRYFLNKNKKEIENEEYMYIHFWCRPISFKKMINKNYFFIYSDVVETKYKPINTKILNKYGKKKYLLFYIKAFIKNRKKISIKKILWNIKNRRKEKNESKA